MYNIEFILIGQAYSCRNFKSPGSPMLIQTSAAISCMLYLSPVQPGFARPQAKFTQKSHMARAAGLKFFSRNMARKCRVTSKMESEKNIEKGKQEKGRPYEKDTISSP